MRVSTILTYWRIVLLGESLSILICPTYRAIRINKMASMMVRSHIGEIRKKYIKNLKKVMGKSK